MANFSKELEFLLKNEIFNSLINSEAVQIAQFNAVIALLMKSGIPFYVEFRQNIKRDPAIAILTIFINSSATVTSSIQFEIRFDI
jgi:hypothetical protein